MEKRLLLSYEKDKFDDFKNNLPCDKENIFPISYLVNENIALKYTGIDGVEKFVIDITTIVLSAKARQDLRIIYESWISALNDKNDDDIYYCVEKTYLTEACDLFGYYFEPAEEFNEEKDTENVSKSIESEKKSVVAYSEKEFTEVIEGVTKRLYGHEAFKADLAEQLKAFILLHKMGRKKLFSALLCGKSGIGKTEVGRILQELMYPGELPIKINFGNYSGKGSLWSLIGSPKGYVGSEQGGELTNKIIRSKSKVIIIDELDKADEAIYTFFYEMLEDGQYTDLDGKLIDLDGYIVIFTANLNNKNFKDKIPEPLFSRFDMTYEFEPLSKGEIEKFVSEYVDMLISDYNKKIEIIDGTSIKNKLIQMDYVKFDNLRNIRRNIMNDFVKEIGVEKIWNDNISTEN